MKRAMLIFGVVLLLSAPVCADERETKFQTANSLFAQGRFKEARDQFARLWAFGKGDRRVTLMLGQCEAALNNHQKARARYQEVLEADPGDPEAQALMDRLEQVRPKPSVVSSGPEPTRSSLETPALDELQRRANDPYKGIRWKIRYGGIEFRGGDPSNRFGRDR